LEALAAVSLRINSAGAGRGVTVTEDEAEWVKYTGQWGTTPSPSNQGWFYTAEPPVSRGVFLRILGHLCPETKTLL